MKCWKDFLEKQKHKFGIETYNKWIKPLKIIKFDSQNIYLEAQDYFQFFWFEEHIKPKIKNNLFNENFQKVKVFIKVKGENFSKKKKIKNSKNKKEEKFSLYFEKIDPKLNFKTFYASGKNKVAYTLLNNLFNENFTSFNPIYIYGNRKSGKTHLLSATKNFFYQKNVIYVKAKTFMHHVVNAMRFSAISNFRNFYRNVDILIVDDVHLFENKIATQEEFFHTFNALYEKNAKIILSSNLPTKKLNLEARLISRFEWGVCLDLEKVDKNGLEKIFNMEIENLNLHFSDSAKHFFLKNLPSPFSLKEGIKTLHLHKKEKFSVSEIKKILFDLIEKEKQKKIDFDKIIEQIALLFHVSTNDILGKSQKKEYVFPRQVAIYFCRKKLGMTLKNIKLKFQRDHSTIITSIKKIQKTEKIDLMEIENSLFP